MDRDLETKLDRHPYGALAAAIGTGYILGGGFFTPLTERIVKVALKVGLRAALVPLLKAQLSQLVGGDDQPAAPPPPPVDRSGSAPPDAR